MTEEKTRFVHVVAIIGGEEEGKILYINPSNIRSGNAELAAGKAPDSDVALVLRDAAGAELGRVYPEVRYEACTQHKEERAGLIQHDLEVPAALAAVELVRGGEVLDAFRPEPPVPVRDVAARLALETSLTGRKSTRSNFGATDVSSREGVTYLIQVKPDNAQVWSTLSIGRKTPEFQIDKNQFPGARNLTVQVIQNSGFTREVVDEREIPLE